MERKKGLLGYYNYTVILTYIGMISGFVGIVSAFEDNYFKAIICLLFAGFCDMFDGGIASTKKDRTPQEKCFGIQIDSLSDLICFGVLPASIVYSMGKRTTLVLGISSLYVLCTLIRLAYFNVDEQERQQTCTGSRKLYLGMPVTLSALFLPLIYSLCNLSGFNSSIVYPSLLVVMAALFLIPFPLKKPKLAGKIALMLCGVVVVGLVIFSFINA